MTVEALDQGAGVTVGVHLGNVLRTGQSAYPVLITIRNDANGDLNGMPLAVEVSGVLEDASLVPPDAGDPPPVPDGLPADFSWDQVPVAWSLWSTAITCITLRVPQIAIPATGSLAMNLVASAVVNCLGQGATQPFTSGSAFDPNDIIGPSGACQFRYLTADDPMHYTIRFENQQAAAFPAGQVVVTHTLDADLDPTTLVLGRSGRATPS